MNASQTTPPLATAPPKSTAREYFESIAIAVILALFVRTWCFQAFKIPTGSMENNLLIGDHLVVNKFLFAPAGPEKAVLPIRNYRRGDVVVFKWPGGPDRDFIKRVIGLPGETLELRQKKVYVNGVGLDEPYVHYMPPRGDSEITAFDKRETYGPVTVPEDQLFVMGDNRDNSEDSRYWGFLPQSYVKGRAVMVYWSFESNAADYERPAFEQLFSGLTGFFTKTRWSRLGQQIQ